MQIPLYVENTTCGKHDKSHNPTMHFRRNVEFILGNSRKEMLQESTRKTMSKKFLLEYVINEKLSSKRDQLQYLLCDIFLRLFFQHV